MSGCDTTRKRILAADATLKRWRDDRSAPPCDSETALGSMTTSLECVAVDLETLDARIAALERLAGVTASTAGSARAPGGPSSTLHQSKPGDASPVTDSRSESVPVVPLPEIEYRGPYVANHVPAPDGYGEGVVGGPGFWRVFKSKAEANAARDLLNAGWRAGERVGLRAAAFAPESRW